MQDDATSSNANPNRSVSKRFPTEEARDEAIVAVYSELGNFTRTADTLGLSVSCIRKVIRSPQGANAVERIMRENARSRAVRLGSLFDQCLDKIVHIFSSGQEIVLKGGSTIRAEPNLKDVVSAVAWISNSLDRWSELVSSHDVIDVTQLSPEEESKNIDRLRALLLEAEKRQAARAPQVQAKPAPDVPRETDAVRQGDQADWFAA